MKKLILAPYLLLLIFSNCQPQEKTPVSTLPLVQEVEPQALLAQASRISEALNYIGNPLPVAATRKLEALKNQSHTEATVIAIQQILDPYCLAMVNINPESRVKVERGNAKAGLIQEGWTSFLVKVHNQAQVTAKLEVESPNTSPILHRASGAHNAKPEHKINPGQLDNRFLELLMYRDRPLHNRLSGLELEYAVLQIYSRHRGQREAKIGFNVGQGTQDIGFRNTIDILFDIKPSTKVVFKIKDEDGAPVMGSFLITDDIERLRDPNEMDPFPEDYRLTLARFQHWQEPSLNDIGKWAQAMFGKPVFPEEQEGLGGNQLRGIYPLPARRLATHDEYPDFFFQPQVYRTSGEHVFLPPGNYNVTYGRGPEYLVQRKQLTIPEGKSAIEAEFQLKRWIHMAELGWYSGDHHIHASGCSHYESPEEGVLPEHMWRQIQGEDLNMGSNLTWGPSWYHQKQFFTGSSHPLSNANNLLRYDIEISGFPSSHAGHLVLLNLQEDDYPNTTKVEDWPSWTLPILQWAKKQGGVVGYAHSGLGLAPTETSDDLPNYHMPKMDGIGANEYIVTVAHDAVDLYSAGNTPPPWELNIWYHTLNSGFTTRISGETDFPCLSDERVGRARIYAKLDGELNFERYMDALVRGRSYVSDGFSHLIDFKVNDRNLGEEGSELNVNAGTSLQITGNAAAYLSEKQDALGAIIASRQLTEAPYWHIERARISSSRKVPVELIVNGEPVMTKEITADGNWQDIRFDHTIDQSSWIALRIYPSAHTNPIFVKVNDNPIAIRKSVEWCRKAVDQCWQEKSKIIRKEELPAAKAAYDHARNVYDEILKGAK